MVKILVGSKERLKCQALFLNNKNTNVTVTFITLWFYWCSSNCTESTESYFLKTAIIYTYSAEMEHNHLHILFVLGFFFFHFAVSFLQHLNYIIYPSFIAYLRM